MNSSLFTIITLVILLSATSLSFAQDDDDDFFIFDEEETAILEIADPFEKLNRAVFSFNDSLYRYFLKPIAIAYRVVPEPARISVSNFYDNIRTPASSINGILQLDMKTASTEFSRFALNSSVGILGLFDPATKMGIERNDQDLGLTLAHYGVGQGFYMVVPFFGSYSLRDGAGHLGNMQISPIMQAWDPDLEILLAYRWLEAETDLSLDKDTYEAFYKSALDPYIFFRSTYVQMQQGDAR